MKNPTLHTGRLGLLMIRADANVGIGTGHVMRCLALAQEWQRQGGEVLFVQADSTKVLQQRLRREKMRQQNIQGPAGGSADAQQTVALARTHHAVWVVADGYRFGVKYQRLLKTAGLRLLLVDDYGHAKSYSADLVLNQNLSASKSLYRNRSPHTRLLLGSAYVMLRREFLTWCNWRREIPVTAGKVLVSLGGADSKNISTRLIAALPRSKLVVVAGAANPHRRALLAAAREHAPRVRLVFNAANMPELMAAADIAITAGGSSTWETAFMGLPSLVFITAPNQAGIATALHRRRICQLLSAATYGFAPRVLLALTGVQKDRALRQVMSQRGRQLIDGQGAQRIVQLLSTSEGLTLSPQN